MALSSRKDAQRLRKLRKLIKGELIKVCSAQYQDKLPARHQLKLGKPELKSLRRLADSDDAVRTLAQLETWCERKGRGSCWTAIVMAYAEAERLKRQFPKHIEESSKTLEGVKPLRDALDLLRGFSQREQE